MAKKNDSFFVQLEDEDAKSTPVAKAPVKSAPADVATSAPVPAAAPAAKVETKAAKTKTEKKSAPTAETPKVEAAPVAAEAAPVITNFATDYLIKPSSNNDRRRPGANMRQFMDLARQMDKPKPFKATAVERKAAEKPVEKSAEKKSPEPSSK